MMSEGQLGGLGGSSEGPLGGSGGARHAFDPADPLGFTSPIADGAPSSHLRRCMVCGPDAPAGFHLRVQRSGDEVVARFAFGPEHEGGPSLAHGGAVAAVLDDLLGHVLRIHATPGVTRRLEVEYLRPVVLGESLRLAARLDRAEDRKLWISGEGRDDDGIIRFKAQALFIRVGRDHFLAGLPPSERARLQGITGPGEADVSAV